MKKLFFTAALCLMPFVALADGEPNEPTQSTEANTETSDGNPKKETKFDRFTSTYGSFICFTDYEIEPLKFDNAGSTNNCEIRVYTDLDTNKKTGFLRMYTYESKYKWESIEYSDLGKIIEAIEKLKTNFDNTDMPSHYHTCFFRSEDGLDIGYTSNSENKEKARWFMTIARKTHRFKKKYDFENALRGIYNQMTELLK